MRLFRCVFFRSDGKREKRKEGEKEREGYWERIKEKEEKERVGFGVDQGLLGQKYNESLWRKKTKEED